MDNFTPQQIEQFLQEFFDVVGTRQYTGARYVPIFGRAGEDTVEWDDLAPYEPLTVVMHEGISYVSRRYVPRGIQVTDTAYWAQTYRFNAQVEQYRQEVLAFQGQIDALDDGLETEREERRTADEALMGDVRSLFAPLPEDPNPKYGEVDQVLSSLGNGDTVWRDPVTITPEVAGPVIAEWLDDHPEATTTVTDGSITFAKLNDSVTKKLPMRLVPSDFAYKSFALSTTYNMLTIGNADTYYGWGALKRCNHDMVLYKDETTHRVLVYWYAQDLSLLSSNVVAEAVQSGFFAMTPPSGAVFFGLMIGTVAWDPNDGTLDDINILSGKPLDPIGDDGLTFDTMREPIATVGGTQMVSDVNRYSFVNPDFDEIVVPSGYECHVRYHAQGKTLGAQTHAAGSTVRIWQFQGVDTYVSLYNTQGMASLETLAGFVPSSHFPDLRSARWVRGTLVIGTYGFFNFTPNEQSDRLLTAVPIRNVSNPQLHAFVSPGFRLDIATYQPSLDLLQPYISEIGAYKEIKLCLSGYMVATSPNVPYVFDSANKVQTMFEETSCGHRCYMNEAPENTIEALVKAAQNGYHFVECDVRQTSDGVFVIVHDENLSRLCGVDVNVSEITYAQLQTYDIVTGSHISDYEHVKIPSLDDFLAAARLLNTTVLLDNANMMPYDELIPHIYMAPVIPRLTNVNGSTRYDGMWYTLGNDSYNYQNLRCQAKYFQLMSVTADIDDNLAKAKELGMPTAVWCDVADDPNVLQLAAKDLLFVMTNSYGGSYVGA